MLARMRSERHPLGAAATIDELETTNEELQSANEELQTTNEELQSTNEELETMNEELQSTNEELSSINMELQAINDELRLRTEELNEVNAFMESILASMRGGVVVVDRELKVQVWNARAEDLWGLRPDEAEHRHLLSLDIGLPDRTGDRAYLERLEGGLPKVFDARPDVVFYLAGADPFEQDQLGGLSLTKEGLVARDRMVIDGCRARPVPAVVLLAGGYASRLDDTVDIHCATISVAAGLPACPL